jgi:tRNA (cmo5U34)-methyltransferase
MENLKASVEEIRARFDQDVERFSSLETGQMTTQDAALVLDLIAESASRVTPHPKSLLDLGCGAGNFSLKLAARFSLEQITLVDLSANMLDRAVDRLREAAPAARLHRMQSDIRDVRLEPASQDLVIAAAVLHHLRREEEWQSVFQHLFQALRRGGSFWIWDFVEHDIPGLQHVMWNRYGDFLVAQKGEEHRRKVFEYVAYEDSPRSVPFQLQQLRAAGFTADVVHKNGCFAAIGAVRP